ncbi:ankyrin repeat-containing domain protein [Cladorrhinum sp. PSN259]|nr:ankyrin repeat-containing domain protein [Cladorrhinum sp. PSN259]
MAPSFHSLSLELFWMITSYLWDGVRDQDVDVEVLCPLSMVNRACHALLSPTIYRNAYHKVILWAVANNSLCVLKAVLRHTNQDLSALLEYRVTSVLLQGPRPLPVQQLYLNRETTDDWRLRPARNDDDSSDLRQWQPNANLLHLACAYDAKDVAEFLLDLGIPIDSPSQAFCSCLQFKRQLRMGSQENNDEMMPVVERLEDPAHCPEWLPLHHAICSRSLTTAICLLKRGSPLLLDAGALQEANMTALQCAIAHGLVDVVRYLLDEHDPRGSNINNSVGKSGREPNAMHYLALCYDSESCRSIIKLLEGAGLSLRSMTCHLSPVATACKMGNFIATQAFLEAGASPFGEIQWHNCLQLLLGAHYGSWSRLRTNHEESKWREQQSAICSHLVLEGVPTDCEMSGTLIAPLMLAAKNGLLAEMKLLLNWGNVDINQYHDCRHSTALIYATAWGQMKAVEILLDAGADINGHRPENYLTAAHCVIAGGQWASDKDQAKAIRFLLSEGANFGIPQETEFHDIETSALFDLMANYGGDDDEGIYQDSILGVVLENANRFNIDEDSWQQALLQKLTLIAAQVNQTEPDFFVARKLFDFGTRLGYLLGDESRSTYLRPFLKRFIRRGSPSFLHSFFSLGDGTGVPTYNGVFTREAALVVVVILRRRDHGILLSLGDWNSIVRGRVRTLMNATLLHLACADSTKPVEMARHLFALRPEDGPTWDLSAVTGNGMTPLMIAVQNESPQRLELVRFLLSRCADPHQQHEGLDASVGHQYEEYDLLRPKTGKRLSRFAMDMINEGKDRLEFDLDAGRVTHCSAFDFAIRLGHVDVLAEFLKHKLPTPDEIVRIQYASSGVFLWAMYKVAQESNMDDLAQKPTLPQILSILNANRSASGRVTLVKILEYATTKSLWARPNPSKSKAKFKRSVVELGTHIATIGELIEHSVEVDNGFIYLLHSIVDGRSPCPWSIKETLLCAFNTSDNTTVKFGSEIGRTSKIDERPADWADPELKVGGLRWARECLENERIFT